MSAVKPWAQADAIALAREIEAICPEFGRHVALTGGLLYKDGNRKDADLLFYRIRQVDQIDTDGLFSALADKLGMVRTTGFGWCIKAEYQGKPIDCFFPEEDGEYPYDTDENSLLAGWAGGLEDEAWLREQLRELGQNYNGEPA